MNNGKKILSLLTITTISLHASAEALLTVKSPARKPSSQVTYRKSGVPVFEMVKKDKGQYVKVKDIPKLDIGDERLFEAKDMNITLPAKREVKLANTSVRQSPPMVQIPKITVTVAAAQVKKIANEENIQNIKPVNPLDIVPDPVVNDTQVSLQKMIDIKPEEYKMLQALIYLEIQKKYDLAMSLFVDLIDVPQYHNEALYHYAETAFGLDLFSEFREKMIQTAKETKDPELKKMAVEQLVKHITTLEVSDIGLIDPLTETLEVDTTNNDQYLLKKAKFFADNGNLGQIENALMYIPTTSNVYPEATLLKAIFNYRQGQVDAAIADLEAIWPSLANKKRDHIRNLSALTLARLHFQKGNYQTSYDYYLKIDKTSSVWLQAMVEQAWTQVLAGDNIGAAGNMFSLHTQFFNKAYAPETYIVRTVGYLNLCQYGDGVAVLNDLKKRYSSVEDKLTAFKKTNTDPLAYYELIKSSIRNSDLNEVQGVPRSFIAELARHPSFTGPQKQINNYEDENNRFNKITLDLIRKEREVRLRMIKAKNEYKVAQSKKASNLKKKEQEYLAVGIEYAIASRAKEGIKKMRTLAIARMDKEKTELRNKIAKTLQTRYSDFLASLDNLIDQKEVLAYEIYSGAGEHIRYQMAGGEIKDRSPAALTPKEDESYKWKYKGEVWEDEIGHYRSSLKNVCPSDDVAQGG